MKAALVISLKRTSLEVLKRDYLDLVELLLELVF